MGKRYKCPYCELRDERKKLIIHIDKRHEEMLPEGYDGARIMYDKINHTDGHGNCRVCKKPTPWNYKAQRYDTLCSNPKCKEAMREEYKKNMLRVRGTYNILNDPQQQEKMLANRSISGKYKFRDGGIVTYTGSYEEKFLEFIDNVMEISSKDILMPGPTIEYWYKGEKHFYITDCLYIPFNAIIEIKDGGNNPNNKSTPGMIASREKTVQKEKIITDRGEYNYIRLTNNEFTQLIEFFMEIKEKMLNDDPSMTVRIHETSVSSELDKNYKTKGKKSLSDFKCIKINEDNIKQFKELKHLRIKNCDGYMYLDGDNLACFYNTEHKDNGEYWIQAIEVLPLYKNYSLGTQLLKKCESLGANRLSVNKSNKVAINMYKKNGWKEYDNSDSMIFMNKGTIKESYLEESRNMNKVPKNVKLYHGSRIQGLKEIIPHNNSISKIGNVCAVYATSDKRFAACYGALWNDSIARQGSWDNWNTVIMGISNAVDINSPCSLYELENDGSFFKISSKEVVSLNTIKVIKEYKYSSYKEMLKKNNVKITSYDNYIKNVNNPNPKFDYLYENTENINESVLLESSNNKLYFISEKQDLKKLEPRIPNNFFTKNGYEDSKTPRVCFSTDIGKCLSALSMNCTNHEYYVYSPAKDYKVITPTQKQVPDVKITDEKWITEPVELIYIGKILCIGDDGKDGMPFKYGNNTAELYGWKWKWIEKHNINESVLLESVKEIRYIDYRSNEAKKYIESDAFLKRTYRNSQNEYNGEIAVDGDNVVGYIFIGDKTDKGFINSLVVYSKYRKHGIATRLLNDAISKYGGYDLTVKKNNKIAIEMYKNKGFVFVGNGNSSSEYYMKLKSHLSNDEKKMVLDESYLIEDSIDSINKAFVDDFKKYINENPKGYNKEIKPLGTPITYTAKKKNEKWLLLATYNGELNKKTSSSFLPQLQKNVKYNGENIEYHTCYLPGDIYIFIKLPNGGR